MSKFKSKIDESLFEIAGGYAELDLMLKYPTGCLNVDLIFQYQSEYFKLRQKHYIRLTAELEQCKAKHVAQKQ